MESFKLEATESQFGLRLDTLMAQKHPDHSRSYWQKMIEQGKLLVNDKQVSPSYNVKGTITITIEAPYEPVKKDIPVLFQDDSIMVINKPSGVLSHSKGDFNPEYTVASLAAQYTKDKSSDRPGIVHRLDRETSGIMVIAVTEETKRSLQKQFSNRTVTKTYEALVEGVVKDDKVQIDAPIKRNPSKPQTFTAAADGKAALTNVTVLKRYDKHSFVKLAPKTGRTHQLRVHLKYIDHPIVGDRLYGTQSKLVDRLFLHAKSLEFTHPTTNKRVSFEAELPADLKDCLKNLR